MTHDPTAAARRAAKMKCQAALAAGCAAASLMTACGGGSDGPPSASPPPAQIASAPAPAGWWTPTANTSWHWQLRGTLNTGVDAAVYDIDLFNTSAATISQLKAAGHKVVCYFSAGSAENWRTDYPSFLASDMGQVMKGWPDEKWIDIRSANVRNIMGARLDLAQAQGCDGVEPDNVDGYANATGFALTAQDQLDYNRFLATQAHARGMAVALKNDVGQLNELEPSFDFALNEQCFEYGECGGYSVFTSKDKPVFNAEYKAEYVDDTDGARTEMCAAAQQANLRTLVLPLELDGSFRYSCD